MKYLCSGLKIVLTVSLFAVTVGFASDQKLPVVGGEKVVATVNGEPMTLREFDQELKALERTAGHQEVGMQSKNELLRRMINTRLIIQEARRMGLHELPELKNRVEVFSRVTLRDALMERYTKNIKADEKEVERVYKEDVKGWKIKSILFEKEEDAKKMEKEIKAGKNFDETLKKFLAEGKGKGDEEADTLIGKDLLPEIAVAVSKMQVGSISPIIGIKSGFVILKLEDIRFQEDPEAREQARYKVLREKHKEALQKYGKVLKEKYAKVNQEVLKGLDFESKEPGFERLLKDKRVVAEIKGEKPITVGEMAEYLRQQLYHGVERAAESKKLNRRKVQILDEMIHKRVFQKEALRLGIDKTEDYRKRVQEYANSLIFGVFVQKAVAPDIQLNEEELRTYHDQHIKEYTYPEMMKISSLIFSRREEAERALTSLRKGTDFQWLGANAEGQVDKNAKGILNFEGNLLTTKDLPENVQKVVSGAKSGDFRLYESPESYFYVLSIREVIPSKPQPYPEVREKIAKKIYNEKLTKAAEEYAGKLRALSDVKIYLIDH
jgi:hypothetical protein